MEQQRKTPETTLEDLKRMFDSLIEKLCGWKNAPERNKPSALTQQVMKALELATIIQERSDPTLENLIEAHINARDVYHAGANAAIDMWGCEEGGTQELIAAMLKGFIEHNQEIIRLQSQRQTP